MFLQRFSILSNRAKDGCLISDYSVLTDCSQARVLSLVSENQSPVPFVLFRVRSGTIREEAPAIVDSRVQQEETWSIE